jgi:hypothetical protein
MGNGLRQIAPDDPAALELAEALRDQVEARQADNGAAGRQRAATEIKRMYVAFNLSGWTGRARMAEGGDPAV